MNTLNVMKESVTKLDTNGIAGMVDHIANEIEYKGAFKPWKLLVFGYRNDPRELYEIPEVRQWCQRVAEQTPFLAYLIDEETIRWFVYSQCEVEKHGSQVALSPIEVARLLLQCEDSMKSFLDDHGRDPGRLIPECRTRFGEALGTSADELLRAALMAAIEEGW